MTYYKYPVKTPENTAKRPDQNFLSDAQFIVFTKGSRVARAAIWDMEKKEFVFMVAPGATDVPGDSSGTEEASSRKVSEVLKLGTIAEGETVEVKVSPSGVDAVTKSVTAEMTVKELSEALATDFKDSLTVTYEAGYDWITMKDQKGNVVTFVMLDKFDHELVPDVTIPEKPDSEIVDVWTLMPDR